LLELLKTASVTEAAIRLNLTQSTVSGSLRQLREILNDELLVLKGRKMTLTRVSQELLPVLESLLAQLADLVETDDFTPKVSNRIFQLFMADYLGSIVLPPLRSLTNAEAPDISLRITSAPRATVDQLRAGELDVMIFPDRQENWDACGIEPDRAGLHVDILFRERMVGLQCASRRRDSHQMTINEYLSRPHVEYVRGDVRQTIEQKALTEAGYRQKTQCHVPYFWLIPQLIVGSDLIALVPQTFSNACARVFAVDVFEVPLIVEPFDVVTVTSHSRRLHADIAWLLDGIHRALGEEFGTVLPEKTDS
jgi:LysR family nod box-dependent transcriptional activator